MKHYIKILVFIFIPMLLFPQHWTQDKRITTNSAQSLTSLNNARCIAVSPSGVLHIIWMDNCEGSFAIYYARSINYGQTWSEPQRLTNIGTSSIYPSIVVSSYFVHVVWVEVISLNQGKICYKRSLDLGISWEEPITYIDSAPNNSYPSIYTYTHVLSSRIYVTWMSVTIGIKATHSTNFGATWMPAQVIYNTPPSGGINGASSITCNYADKVHVVIAKYSDGNSKLVYIRSSDGGNSWEAPRDLPGTGSNDGTHQPAITSFDSILHIIWPSGELPTKREVILKHISSLDGGNTWGQASALHSSLNFMYPTVTIDEANILHVVWHEENNNYAYYKRSIDNGITWQPNICLTANSQNPAFPFVDCNHDDTEQWTKENGIYILWTDERDGNKEMYFKRGWQIGEYATCPNQGRHLDRTVNATNCYPVFQGEKAVFWQSRNSQTVNPPVGISDGKYPSIAVSPAGLSWTCYTTEDVNDQHLKCQIRDDFSMEEIPLFDAESIFAPSLILATKEGDMGYVVYTIKDEDEYQIRFTAFDEDRVYYQISLDHGNDDYPVSKPSITITPGDYLHIVWQKFDNNINRIFYITTLAPFSPDMIRNGYEPQWSSFDPVSTPDNPYTEPASNPFVEAYGDHVYVAWRGPYDQENPIGEIWQRSGLIRPWQLPFWSPPRNVSESPEEESDYPVQSTIAFVAWQELEDQNNSEIKLRYNTDDVRNISNTETPSQYPHINVMYTENEVPRVYFIWTETNAPDIYELRFRDYQYLPEKDNLDEIVYYMVNTGDSTPSFYCEHRDGYIRYPNYPIDFGQLQLRYRLDYLNPAYYYKIKAIVYQNTTGRFQQTLTFDNIPVDSIEFPAGRPETVEIYIPKNTYSQDLQSILRANRTQGNFSALTTFGLTQFEIIDSTSAGVGPQSANNTTVTLTPIDNFPNPFRTHTSVHYSLPIACRVSLAIYNASGRLVKTLVNESQSSGIYSVNWDGTDNQKKVVPAGVYFFRLDTDYSSQTKKVSIIR